MHYRKLRGFGLHDLIRSSPDRGCCSSKLGTRMSYKNVDNFGKKSNPISVVCVGLSSGGIEPLKTIFQQLSANTGMGFVVIPHLSRTYPTQLPFLLSTWSEMPAEFAAAGMPIEGNHIYVIPPGQEITVEDGHFGVQPRSSVKGWSNVITLFLKSVSRIKHPAGVAVILSGVDADGSAALQDFHARGGIVIAQDPSSAAHRDMPRAAIGTGCVDYVMQPEAIAAKIEEIATETSNGHQKGRPADMTG